MSRELPVAPGRKQAFGRSSFYFYEIHIGCFPG